MSFWYESDDPFGALQMANEVRMPLLVYTADDSDLSKNFDQVFASGKADQVISGNYIAIKVMSGSSEFNKLKELLSLQDISNVSIFVEGSIRALIDTCNPNTDELTEDLNTAIITIKKLDDGECVDSIRESLGSNSNATLNLKPLTEEEKAKKKEEFKNLLEKRRAERLLKEKEEAKEREVSRREIGKSLTTAKVQQQEKEMKQILEKKLKDKQEDRVAKQRVREQIAQDKAERAARRQHNTPQPTQTSATSTTPVARVSSSEPPSACKLAIRLPDGSVQRLEFKPIQLLQDVREQLMSVTNIDSAFRFQSSYPPKLFTPEDEKKTLLDLGLCPTNSLIVKKT